MTFFGKVFLICLWDKEEANDRNLRIKCIATMELRGILEAFDERNPKNDYDMSNISPWTKSDRRRNFGII